jgi:hypothetical protein
MTDITNKDRAGWAGMAVLEYATAKGSAGGLYDPPETVLTDLLCDLMHYASAKEIDFAACLDRARLHYDAELAEEAGNQFGLRCPKCGRGDEIDIAATVWVRLCPDGTDIFAAANGDHEWSDHSGAVCIACGYSGNVSDFSKQGEPS